MDKKEISIRIMREEDLNCAESLPGECERGEGLRAYLRNCLEENRSGVRTTIAAFLDGKMAGYVHILYESAYPYFRNNKIPEINDLYVRVSCRRCGIGRALVETCERHVSGKYGAIGLGVGLYKDYGHAQRLYAAMGFIPDGNGLMYKNAEVPPGRDVFVDDDLLLYLCKKL